MYRSPNSTKGKNDLLNQTTEYLSKLKGKQLLLGDFNCSNCMFLILSNIVYLNFLRPLKTSFYISMFTFLYQHFLHQIRDQP